MTSASAHEPPFALDGAVTTAKVLELIGVQTELKWLDYKRECDLGNTYERVEFAKDSGAMQIAGGYRLVGVDDDGTVVGLAPGAADQFDDAKLRDKLDKYLGPGYEVRSAVQTVDVGSGPNEVAIIWVAPHPDGCNVFSANGDYTDANGKPRTVFREGDVYARHGSKSERWNQADRAEANRNRDARARDQWRAENAAEFQKALHAATTAAAVTTEPAATYTWTLDAAGFDAATVELMRHDDDIPIRQMMRSAQTEVRRLVSNPLGRIGVVANADPASAAASAADDLQVVLDRLTTVAALALDLDRSKYFTLAAHAFAELYGRAVQDLQVQTSEHGLVPVLWLRIAERLYALGGLAVRRQKWFAVRELALLDVGGLDDRGRRTWHRDALIQSSRAELFKVTRPNGTVYEAALPMFARGVVARLPALRPDLPNPDAQVTERDPLLVSICSFDLLAAIVASSNVQAATQRDVFEVSYPNFSRFGGPYDSVVGRLLEDQDMRSILLGPVSDAVLARVLDLIDAAALAEGQRFWGWEGYRDQVVKDFIADHQP
jgi:hypothetical protein